MSSTAETTGQQPLSAAYRQRCRAARRELSALWQPAAGDWVEQDGSFCVLDAAQAARAAELAADRAVCWLPRLDQLLSLLGPLSPHIVLDCYRGDFACICFDDVSRRIADVVAETPELACLQALLFIRAELAAQASQQQ